MKRAEPRGFALSRYGACITCHPNDGALLLFAATGPKARHPLRDVVLDLVRLRRHRARQRLEGVARIMQLVDQRQNDRQARVLKPHAIVQVARERHARLVEAIEEIPAVVAMWRDDTVIDPRQQHMPFEICELRDKFAFPDHVTSRPFRADVADVSFPTRP